MLLDIFKLAEQETFAGLKQRHTVNLSSFTIGIVNANRLGGLG
jgi:hypothetical protein